MKVLHILDSVNRGGAETLVLDVCRNAARCGLDMAFVATGGGGLEREFEASGAPYFRLQRRSAIDRRLVRELRELIEREQIEVVHCHQAVEAMHAYRATRRLGRKVRLVLTFHSLLADLRNRIALRLMVPRVDDVIAVSRHVEGQMAEEGYAQRARGIEVIYNGVDRSRLAGGADLRTLLGVDPAAKLLGMVGNFYGNRTKDQLTICRALPRVLGRSPDTHFVFVGRTPPSGVAEYAACVEACRAAGIEKSVHFAGTVENVGEMLSSLDVFVFSSRSEGLPLSVIEAMVAGLPVVVNDIPALMEVTDDGRVASVFRTGDADDLATKIVEMLDDRERSETLARESKEWAVSQFSIERHIDSLKELYASLM